jgi:hypothetical protein
MHIHISQAGICLLFYFCYLLLQSTFTIRRPHPQECNGTLQRQMLLHAHPRDRSLHPGEQGRFSGTRGIPGTL